MPFAHSPDTSSAGGPAMRIGWMLAAALLFVLPARGETDAVIRVDYSNPGLYPAQWTLEFHPDGSGHFHAEGGTKPNDEDETISPGKVDRDINLSADFAGRVFSEVRDSRVLH